MIDGNTAHNVDEFESLCKKHIESAIHILNSQWLPTIKNIFLQVTKFTILFYNIEFIYLYLLI